jgi:hypothetical protein
MAVALSALRTQARERADILNSTHVTDSELTTYINQGGAALHDAIVASNEDYVLTSVEFTLTTTNTYTLPDDFYKLRGLDYSVGGNWTTVEPFSFTERNRFDSIAVEFENIPSRAYRVMQSDLFILPENNASGTYRLWYLLRYVPLADDGDELDDLWSEYVVVYAARKCLAKEESSTVEIDAELANLMQRVLMMTAKRDLGVPRRIADVRRSARLSRWGYR